MARCEMCGKGPRSGHNVSHAKNRTKRKFRPNVQKKTIYIDGKRRRMNICTRCLKTLSKTA